MSTGGTSLSQCACKPGYAFNASTGECWLPIAVVLSSSSGNSAYLGCYAVFGVHNGASLFKQVGDSTGAPAAAPSFVAYVNRNGGEWAVLPTVDAPEKRYAVSCEPEL
jgi:hypothetical protein